MNGFRRTDVILYGLKPEEMRTVLSGRIGIILPGAENTEKGLKEHRMINRRFWILCIINIKLIG